MSNRANIIAVEETRPDQLHMYGVVGVGARKGRLFSITSMVEKPSPTQAPSNFIVTGRYLLQPEIFDFLGMHESGVSGEIQLTDAMIALGGTQAFYGFEFEGRSHDCGSKVGFLAANVAYALAREDMAQPARAAIDQLLQGELSNRAPHPGSASARLSPYERDTRRYRASTLGCFTEADE